MQIWLDGDACPKLIKDVIFRAVIRTKTPLIVVANHALSIPASPYIKKWQVGAGFDVADQQIVDSMNSEDLVITADIPLADAVVTKGGTALNPRGELYTIYNIKQHLSMRNLSESIRSSGAITGGPPKLHPKDVQNFSNSLDRFLTQRKK
jgi:uncharacterized protein